jgi:hypothetical protein
VGRRRWHVEYGRKYKIPRQQAVSFRRHAPVGHAFQGRFKPILGGRERYLLELARYIVLDPVRARWSRTPGSLLLFRFKHRQRDAVSNLTVRHAHFHSYPHGIRSAFDDIGHQMQPLGEFHDGDHG